LAIRFVFILVKFNFKERKHVIVAAIAFGLVMVSLMVLAPAIATTVERSNGHKMPEIDGSANVGEAINEIIEENLKVEFTQAASTAEAELSDNTDTIIKGKLGIAQGYLVYKFIGINDEEQEKYKVIIDAGNGDVLYKSEAISMKEFSTFHSFDMSAELTMSEAAGIAQAEIDNGVVRMGKLRTHDDNTVYFFVVADTEQDLKYIVTIDADNGEVLQVSEGMSTKSWGFFGKHHGGHGYDGHGDKTWSDKYKN